jgi:PKHD-type hydroxylase
MRGLYKVMRNFITPEEARDVSEAVKQSPPGDGDSQIPNSYSYYNLAVGNILLGRLADKVSEAAGKRLTPTYSYCRVCFKGAELKAHKDRPSCEYSVTLNLSQTHPWIIYMGKRGVKQSPGDGVLYRGCDIEHSRPIFEGDEYIQVFLHYVDADGPYKDYKYDKKKEEFIIYRFTYLDPFPNQVNYYRFNEVVSLETVDNLRKILDSKQLRDAQIGGGDVDKVKRSAQIYWLPKTDEFLEIYKTFQDLVGKCNSEFYKFNITEITEQIQYTVYNSSEQGHYDWHIDMGPDKAKRKLSLVCQLSDPSEYEGGELQINAGNIMIPEKDKGTIIIFPSYLLHRVTPVTKGTRRSLVLWIEGPAFI